MGIQIKDGPTWKDLPAAGIPDAPSNSKQYARKDGAWVEVAAGGSTPPTAITALANVKFGAAAGSGITHILPASPATGQKAQYLVTASGADRSLNLDSAIRLPSDSALSLPKNMTSGKTYIAQFEYFGSFWGLTTLVGGY